MGLPAKWTFERCKSEAAKYRTRYEFQKGSGGTYQAAFRNRWIDEICAHMEKVRTAWTFERCKSEAKGYRTRYEFQKGSSGIYQAARNNGWLDEICAHMEKVRTTWTLETCRLEAKGCRTRNEVMKGSMSAYDAAWRNRWLDEICVHMERGTGGFNPDIPGFLYSREFLSEGGIIRPGNFKIGITNFEPANRASQFGAIEGLSMPLRSLVHFEDGRLCADVERRIKRLYKSDRYEIDFDGPHLIDSGMTEVFTRNVFLGWLESPNSKSVISTSGVTVVMNEGKYLTGSDIGIEEIHGRDLLREISKTFENGRQTLKMTGLLSERIGA